jgi:MFS family permease
MNTLNYRSKFHRSHRSHRSQRSQGGRLGLLGLLGLLGAAPDFRRFYAGYAASLLGTQLSSVAIAFAVLGDGGTPTGLGLVFAAGIIPMIVFALGGGAVADRLGRRPVMLTADLVCCAAQGGLAAALLTGRPPLWLLAVAGPAATSAAPAPGAWSWPATAAARCSAACSPWTAGPAAAVVGARAVLGFGAAWAACGTLAVLTVPSVRHLTWADPVTGGAGPGAGAGGGAVSEGG